MIDLTKVADADIELVVQWDDEDVAIGETSPASPTMGDLGLVLSRTAGPHSMRRLNAAACTRCRPETGARKASVIRLLAAWVLRWLQ